MYISTLTYSPISSLQLTKAVIFSKRLSLGKGRQAAHSSDKTYWGGRFVGRFDALTPCLPQSRKVEEEAQWKPMGVLWMLHPFCQQVNKGHTSSDGVHVCQCVSPLSRSSGSVSTVTESISIKDVCSQSIQDYRFWMYQLMQLMQLSLWTLVSLVMSIHPIILMVIVSLIAIFTALSRKSSPRAAAQQLAKSITWAITVRVSG